MQPPKKPDSSGKHTDSMVDRIVAKLAAKPTTACLSGPPCSGQAAGRTCHEGREVCINATHDG